MPIRSPEDLFITVLSHLHSAETRTKAVCDELSQMAEDPNVRKWFELNSYLEGQHLANVEQCFKMLGKQPVQAEGRWVDVFAENFRNVWYAIKSPEMKALYLLISIRKIQNLHIAEYGTLAVMAAYAGYADVAVLLERNREDKIAHLERSNRMLLNRARQKLGEEARGDTAAIQNAEDLFITVLSHLQSTETRTKAICDELVQLAQDPDAKRWFALTAYVQAQHLANVEQCFKLLGKQPVQLEGKWVDIFAENFRNVWKEIHSPAMKALYLLITVRRIQNFHIAEYTSLAVMAELAGYEGVAVLLERNREDKIAHIERSNEVLASRLRQELGSHVREEFGEQMLKRVA